MTDVTATEAVAAKASTMTPSAATATPSATAMPPSAATAAESATSKSATAAAAKSSATAAPSGEAWVGSEQNRSSDQYGDSKPESAASRRI